MKLKQNLIAYFTKEEVFEIFKEAAEGTGLKDKGLTPIDWRFVDGGIEIEFGKIEETQPESK